MPRPAGVNRVNKVNLVHPSGSTLSILSTLSKTPAGRGHFVDQPDGGGQSQNETDSCDSSQNSVASSQHEFHLHSKTMVIHSDYWLLTTGFSQNREVLQVSRDFIAPAGGFQYHRIIRRHGATRRLEETIEEDEE